jgi:hypothetical protein
MSAALAYARPQRQPQWQPTPHHIEIVTTRAQRKARPKSFYAVVTVASIFALFMGQLMLSMMLSDGAYKISALQAEQKDLLRTEQSLSEHLDLLASPQSLATRAESLGMVVGTNAPTFLRLSDGSLIGTPVAASGSTGAIGAGGGLVANFLLSSMANSDSSPAASQSEGAPSQNSASGSVASDDGALPSPTTR